LDNATGSSWQPLCCARRHIRARSAMGNTDDGDALGDRVDIRFDGY
jgi:hypothetical protein|tara:strand:+ start:29828 stop:29965 length:138 start_codon:yes stop_codon:yes gene_type:complete